MSEYYLGFTGAQLDDAINKVRSGYVLPSETINITSNVQDMDISKGKKLNVNVPVPDNYINLADIIMHCTKSANGTFTGSGQKCENLSIGLSFRPKVILIIATSPITTTNGSSPYEICAVWRIMNDDYRKLRDNCVFVYKSGSNVKSGHTEGNGLKGNADNTITGWGTTVKFASGTTYSWYAWG